MITAAKGRYPRASGRAAGPPIRPPRAGGAQCCRALASLRARRCCAAIQSSQRQLGQLCCPLSACGAHSGGAPGTDRERSQCAGDAQTGVSGRKGRLPGHSPSDLGDSRGEARRREVGQRAWRSASQRCWLSCAPLGGAAGGQGPPPTCPLEVLTSRKAWGQ